LAQLLALFAASFELSELSLPFWQFWLGEEEKRAAVSRLPFCPSQSRDK